MIVDFEPVWCCLTCSHQVWQLQFQWTANHCTQVHITRPHTHTQELQ